MKLTKVAAAVEIAAGLIFMISPSLVAQLVLNAELSPAGEAVGRVGGFGLAGLGIACWLGSAPVSAKSAATRGLLAYNVLAAIFFTYLGVQGALVGILLWPAAVLHAILAVLLGRAFILDVRTG
jgi:hypothetical protein